MSQLFAATDVIWDSRQSFMVEYIWHKSVHFGTLFCSKARTVCSSKYIGFLISPKTLFWFTKYSSLSVRAKSHAFLLIYRWLFTASYPVITIFALGTKTSIEIAATPIKITWTSLSLVSISVIYCITLVTIFVKRFMEWSRCVDILVLVIIHHVLLILAVVVVGWLELSLLVHCILHG